MQHLVSLDKYYNIAESGPVDYYEEYGKRLREVLYKALEDASYQTIKVLKNDELYESIHSRYIDYLQKRIINLGISFFKDEITKKVVENEVDVSLKFLSKLEEIFEFDSKTIRTIHKIAYKICINYINNTGIPSTGEKNFIQRIAKENLHKCYICGRDFNLTKEITQNRNNLEIEHIFPRIYGGSRNKQNLTVCCENCNKIKDDMISYSDTYFESFITSSSKSDNVKSSLKKELKISLIMKQNLSCSICEKKFYAINDLEKFYFIKKENDDIFHYFNTEVCCQRCYENNKITEGVEIELQL